MAFRRESELEPMVSIMENHVQAIIFRRQVPFVLSQSNDLFCSEDLEVIAKLYYTACSYLRDFMRSELFSLEFLKLESN